MTRLTARQRKYRDLLSPLAHDRAAVSVLLSATAKTNQSLPERKRIANDLYVALEEVLLRIDREAAKKAEAQA